MSLTLLHSKHYLLEKKQMLRFDTSQVRTWQWRIQDSLPGEALGSLEELVGGGAWGRVKRHLHCLSDPGFEVVEVLRRLPAS